MTTILEKPKTLKQAQERLRSLGVTVTEMPRTLTRANDELERITGQKFQGPNRVSDTIIQAREYLAKSGASQTDDPADLSAAELEARISATKQPEERMRLFGQLQRRENGEPRKSIAEQAKNLTDLQLEKKIQDTKDPIERGELFRILTQRSRKR
jgi:hypothetical protein